MAAFTCSAKRGVFLVTRCLGWKVVRGWYLRGLVISRGYLMLWGKLVSVCVFFLFFLIFWEDGVVVCIRRACLFGVVGGMELMCFCKCLVWVCSCWFQT